MFSWFPLDMWWVNVLLWLTCLMKYMHPKFWVDKWPRHLVFTNLDASRIINFPMFLHLGVIKKYCCQSKNVNLGMSLFVYFMKHVKSLKEIYQNVATLFATTCNCVSFVAIFGTMYQLWQFLIILQLCFNYIVTIGFFILSCEWLLEFYSSTNKLVCLISHINNQYLVAISLST